MTIGLEPPSPFGLLGLSGSAGLGMTGMMTPGPSGLGAVFGMGGVGVVAFPLPLVPLPAFAMVAGNDGLMMFIGVTQ